MKEKTYASKSLEKIARVGPGTAGWSAGNSAHNHATTETELALGLTLMILVSIGGQEIAHLVNPIAAFLVAVAACCAGVVAYGQGS